MALRAWQTPEEVNWIALPLGKHEFGNRQRDSLPQNSDYSFAVRDTAVERKGEQARFSLADQKRQRVSFSPDLRLVDLPADRQGLPTFLQQRLDHGMDTEPDLVVAVFQKTEVVQQISMFFVVLDAPAPLQSLQHVPLPSG